MSFRDRLSIALGEFLDGPDEDFPEDKPLNLAGIFIGFAGAVLIVLAVMA